MDHAMSFSELDILANWLLEQFTQLGYSQTKPWRDGEFFIGGKQCEFEKDGCLYYFLFSLLADDQVLFGLDNQTESKKVFRHTIQWSENWKYTIWTEILSKMA